LQSYQLLRKNHAENVYSSNIIPVERPVRMLNRNDAKYQSNLNLNHNKTPRDLSNHSKVRLQGNSSSNTNIREARDLSPRLQSQNLKIKTNQGYSNPRQ